MALQSASKKWQQKEQQVMKKVRKLTKAENCTAKVKTSTKTHSAKKVSTTGDHFLLNSFN